MVTQLPSTGKPGCDTSDMNIIHGMFRSILNEAPKLVRSVAQSDTGHAAAVAGHLSDLISGLHNHHHGEDLLLWDELAARAPACAAHVDQMRAQHAAVSDDLDALEPSFPPGARRLTLQTARRLPPRWRPCVRPCSRIWARRRSRFCRSRAACSANRSGTSWASTAGLPCRAIAS